MTLVMYSRADVGLGLVRVSPKVSKDGYHCHASSYRNGTLREEGQVGPIGKGDRLLTAEVREEIVLPFVVVSEPFRVLRMANVCLLEATEMSHVQVCGEKKTCPNRAKRSRDFHLYHHR